MILMENLAFGYAAVAGIVSALLLYYSMNKRDERTYIASLAFLLVSWSGIEWGLWLTGTDLFYLVFKPVIPLASYFIAWTCLVIYVSEKYFRRWHWMAFICMLAFISVIAHFCMNCVQFY